jgi:predicted SprT family Zn-dependent metalloprotease
VIPRRQRTDSDHPGSICAMTEAAAKTLRPVDARRVERILRRLGALWESRALGGIDVMPNARLSKTLGRLVARPWRIELGPRALVSSKTLREVVTHEAAHAATRDGAEHQPPHGPEWRALMARAGYPEAKGARWLERIDRYAPRPA